MPHIETSDVVKKVLKEEDRKKLLSSAVRTAADPDWLGKEVYQEIISHNSRTVVLTGVREIEVHQYLRNHGCEITIFEVTAPPEIRYQRLYALNKLTNAEDFLSRELKEKQMGIEDVEQEAPYTVPTSFETDPERIAYAMIRALKAKKVL